MSRDPHMSVSETPTPPAAGVNGWALDRQLLCNLSQWADEEVVLGDLRGGGLSRMAALRHWVWGTRQPCPGLLELMKTRPRALLRVWGTDRRQEGFCGDVGGICTNGRYELP